MAEKTWIALFQATAFAANKDMGHVHNGASSAKVIRVYRISLNTPTVLGALNFVQIWQQTTAPTGGATITPLPFKTDNTALDANTTCGVGRTVTNANMLRSFLHHNSAPAAGSNSGQGQWFTLCPHSIIWEAGYIDTNIQPLTAPASTACGYGVKGITSASGSIDTEIEFTSEAS